MSINRLTPYLNFDGTAEQAIKLYERALGAQTLHLQRFGEMSGASKTPERIMHARLRIGGGIVMMSDSMPGQAIPPGGSAHVCLDFDDAAEMAQRFDALAAGGKVTMPLQDTFWGAKFGMLLDAYGVQWMFNCMTAPSAGKDAAGGDKATITLPCERSMLIVRSFDAPRERVWRAFTDRELVARWWGRGNKVVIERLEVERGGHWRFVEHADGATHGFEGRVREVKPLERLSQTFEWDGMPGHPAVNTATFEALPDGRTRLTTMSLFHTQEERDGMLESGMEQGLNQSYAALDRILAELR